MRPIPLKMRQEIEKLPRMQTCQLAPLQSLYGGCSGRRQHPEWHHVWTYAGKQINEPWAILAACTYHHDMVKKDSSVRYAFETASLFYAAPEDLAKYPRKNWEQEKRRIFGTSSEERRKIWQGLKK